MNHKFKAPSAWSHSLFGRGITDLLVRWTLETSKFGIIQVVNMDELGAYFNLRTEDAIDRLNFLTGNGSLTGVMDDRGKFIYITPEELQAGL